METFKRLDNGSLWYYDNHRKLLILPYHNSNLKTAVNQKLRMPQLYYGSKTLFQRAEFRDSPRSFDTFQVIYEVAGFSELRQRAGVITHSEALLPFFVQDLLPALLKGIDI